MLTLKPLDETCPIHRQLGVDVSPVVLVNLFTVAAPDVAALLKAWEADANWMKQQPGYISTQLHRAVGESYVFMNYAVWESAAHFKAAFSHPDFRATLGAYPSSVVASPHLFERVAVPNLCTEQERRREKRGCRSANCDAQSVRQCKSPSPPRTGRGIKGEVSNRVRSPKFSQFDI
ncbi:MAG: antibiotic biosynthesis monooxygenase [Pedosphaera sp.]|nr:antibiotic biosynthesis monooxygenase [Pedosphaera sp.]